MTLKELGAKINATAVAHGWWEADRNLGEMYLLAVSEITEAFEEWRREKPALYFKHSDGTDSLGDESLSDALHLASIGHKPEGQGIEIADCMIRLLDTAHSKGWDMDKLIAIKMAYNDTRPYRHGGLKA